MQFDTLQQSTSKKCVQYNVAICISLFTILSIVYYGMLLGVSLARPPQAQLADTIKDIKDLECRVYDRDKPFFQIFGEELTAHKGRMGSLVTELQ